MLRELIVSKSERPGSVSTKEGSFPSLLLLSRASRTKGAAAMSGAAISTTGMAALATSAAAAVLAAGLREEGGAKATERAWTGEPTPDQKERLKGSFVMMKDGRIGYIPISSRAAIFKESLGRSGAWWSQDHEAQGVVRRHGERVVLHSGRAGERHWG